MQRGAVTRVTFNDEIDCGTSMAYSTVYGTLPKLVVATATWHREKRGGAASAHHSSCTQAFSLSPTQAIYLRAFLSRASQRAGSTGKKGPTTGRGFRHVG